MKSTFKRFLPLLLAMVMIIILASCATDQPEATDVVDMTETKDVVPIETEAVEDELVILRVGETDDVDCWNPYGCFAAWGFGFLIYEGFTDHGPGPSSPGTPRLAESWEFSDDGMTATIHLHEGITFSDGTPFTAQTAVDYINWMNSTGLVYWFAETLLMESVEALDDTTLQYTTSVPILNSPDYDWQWWYFGPPHIWGDLDDDTLYTYEEFPPVTTGPYVVSEYEPGSHIVYDAREDYYRGKPPIDRVVVQIYSNVDALLNAFLAGEIDMTAQAMPPETYEKLAAAPGVHLSETPPNGVYSLLFNVHAAGITNPGIQDIEVRKAIDYAIDKQNIVDVVLLGHGITCPNSWACGPNFADEIDPSLEVTPYDPSVANQILDDAGYLDSDGDGIRETPDGEPLELRLLFQTEWAPQLTIADLLTSWLDQVGISVVAEVVDLGSWMSAVTVDRDWDMAIWFSGPDIDPAAIDFRDSCWSAETSQSWSGYCNEEVDNLVYEYWYSDDPVGRWEPMFKAQQIMAEERPSIILAGQNDIQAYYTEKFEFPPNSYAGFWSPWSLMNAIVK